MYAIAYHDSSRNVSRQLFHNRSTCQLEVPIGNCARFIVRSNCIQWARPCARVCVSMCVSVIRTRPQGQPQFYCMNMCTTPAAATAAAAVAVATTTTTTVWAAATTTIADGWKEKAIDQQVMTKLWGFLCAFFLEGYLTIKLFNLLNSCNISKYKYKYNILFLV